MSYVWLTREHPDPKGVQADALRCWLRQHQDIEYVWIDWCCLPQGARNDEEVRKFEAGLFSVNLIYLSCTVLKIVNYQYMSRFWPQFEAWLSCQIVKPGEGFEPDVDETRSFTTFSGDLAQNPRAAEGIKEGMKRWMCASFEAARNHLSQDEVSVTNLSDKKKQFDRVKALLDNITQLGREFGPRSGVNQSVRPPFSQQQAVPSRALAPLRPGSFPHRFVIASRDYPRFCLSLESGGQINGGRVWMWERTNDHNQVWQMHDDGTLRPKAFNTVALSIQEGGGKCGGRVWMWSITRDRNQLWEMEETSQGVLLRLRRLPEWYLSREEGGHRNTGAVWMWSRTCDHNQTWLVEAV